MMNLQSEAFNQGLEQQVTIPVAHAQVKEDMVLGMSTTPADITQIPQAQSFGDGTIIKGSDNTVYLVFGNKKYGISSMTIFRKLGLSASNIMRVGDNTVSSLPTAGTQ